MFNSFRSLVQQSFQQRIDALNSERAFVVFVLSLFLTAFIPTASAAGYHVKYTKLLNNCDAALNESGFADAKKKVVRKIDAGPRFKFWIDVDAAANVEATTEGNSDNAGTYRAYCEGTYRDGEVEVFAFTEGQWRPRMWSVDTETVVKEYFVKQ